MFNLKPIALVSGTVICAVGFFLFIPLVTEIIYKTESWESYAVPILLYLIVGGSLVITNRNIDLKISLKGYTDSKGPDNYNVGLSKQRVNAVKEFLIANGIDNSRILIDALGEKNPVADNTSVNGRKLNRRVEVRFIEQ